LFTLTSLTVSLSLHTDLLPSLAIVYIGRGRKFLGPQSRLFLSLDAPIICAVKYIQFFHYFIIL
ncbi:hypothetical protein L9F63_004970, partial [Diploptera punctata]